LEFAYRDLREISQRRDLRSPAPTDRRRTHSLAAKPIDCGSIEQQNSLNSGWVTNGVKMAEDVRAEIVASVLEVVVSEGDQIGEGDTLVLLESMKMEIPVLAEVAGTVSKVAVAVGDVIQAGDLIAVIS
jgi:acetyl-CoA carboxylase biotin carboxyl carrier protein